MLPAHLAGIYSYDEIHMDLPSIAEHASAKFVFGEVVGLNLEERTIILDSGEALEFDLLSINTGSTPTKSEIKGAAEHSIPVKPVPAFLERWTKLIRLHQEDTNKQLSIIGGGAGGVELAFSARARLPETPIRLIHRGDELLDTHNKQVREILQREAINKKIELELSCEVAEVKASEIVCSSGKSFDSDSTILVTQASAPAWIANAGLDTTDKGFVRLNQYLQSTSHDFVFSAGDVATQEDSPRPKSGVFAVRQAEPLFNNLNLAAKEKPLLAFSPQKDFLSLIGTGDKKAVASRGNLAFYGRSMWILKDWIDRRFMRKFSKP